MRVKQVIVVRKDLKMSTGEVAEKVTDAALKIFFDRIAKWTTNVTINNTIILEGMTSPIKKWVDGNSAKNILSCNTENDIMTLADKAKNLNIPFAISFDNTFNTFNDTTTPLCIALGPDYDDKIDPLIRECEVYK